MRHMWIRSAALCGSLLLGNCAFASPPGTGARPVNPEPAQQEPATPAERELQALLGQLSRASEALLQKAESPDSWRYQMQQAEILLRLAGQSGNAADRDRWLEMAVVSYASAADQCPPNEAAGYQVLTQLPAYLARTFPGSKLFILAAQKEIEADYKRVLASSGEAAANERQRQRLLAFAETYPTTPEAPQAILKAARLCEKMGKNEEACRSYRKLAQAYPANEVARKCHVALARLGGLDGEVVELSLPLLYQAGESEARFDLKGMRGRPAMIHFWSSSSPGAAESFDALKKLTDRGEQVVFVNLDGDASKARAFLTGRLTAGTHVYDTKGEKSALVERCGIESLPHTVQIDEKGAVKQHSFHPSEFMPPENPRSSRDRR